MRLPRFTAAAAVGSPSRSYHGTYRYGTSERAASGQPAVVLPSQVEAFGAIGEEAGLGDVDAELAADETVSVDDDLTVEEDGADVDEDVTVEEDGAGDGMAGADGAQG